MKFELVEFYPHIVPQKNKKSLGTVHLYLIDCELDIRGIGVTLTSKGMYFNFPHFVALDEETGARVRYPLIRFTNEARHKEMMDFLHTHVKPIIWERLNAKSE